jgi:hypothetical protein
MFKIDWEKIAKNLEKKSTNNRRKSGKINVMVPRAGFEPATHGDIPRKSLFFLFIQTLDARIVNLFDHGIQPLSLLYSLHFGL